MCGRDFWSLKRHFRGTLEGLEGVPRRFKVFREFRWVSWDIMRVRRLKGLRGAYEGSGGVPMGFMGLVERLREV